MPASSFPLCAICQSPILPQESSRACPACRSPYHAECLDENGGCAMYGCREVPQTQARDETEVPPGFWGNEHKRCAACGAEMLAAAIRCRSCGTVFETAAPQTHHDYRRHQQLGHVVPRLKQYAVMLFILAVIPCTAPVAAVVGAIWHFSHRDGLSALPAVHAALWRLALIVAIAQTIFAIGIVALYIARS